MKTRHALASLALLTAFALPASAADWHSGSPGQRSAARPDLAARSYLQQHALDLGVDSVDLQSDNDLLTAGLHVYRYTQTWQGLPVFGKRVTVRVDSAGRVLTVMVDVARGLTAPAVPGFSADEAIARVGALGLDRAGKHSEATLGIIPDSRGGKLAWQVDVLSMAGMHRYVLDATDGSLIKVITLAKHVNKGRVYPINDQLTPQTEDVDLANLKLVIPQTLTGRAGTVFSYVSGDLESGNPADVVVKQKSVPDANGDFLFTPSTSEPDFTDNFAEVNVYYHLDRMDSWWRTALNVNLSSSLMAVVNYGPGQQPYDNAFYTNWQGTFKNAIFIGQGSDEDFAYDSDVFLHEFTHFVNSTAIHLSNGPFDFDQYGMVIMPGAMEEGTADYFSSTVNDDPIVGEASLGQYARDLTQDVDQCPNSLFGESHEDGKLIGTTTWAIRTAIGKELADPLIWNTMATLPDSPSFGDVADGLQKGADALKAQGKLTDQQVNSVMNEVRKRGLDQCPRFLELVEGQNRYVYMAGLEFIGYLYGGYQCSDMKQYFGLSAPFQFKFKPEATDKQLKIQVSLDKIQGGGTVDWGIYVRAGSPVLFDNGYMDPSVAKDYDYKVEKLTTTEGEIVIDTSSTPPFDPSKEYYVAIGHKNCAFTQATISGTGDGSVDPPKPDAGPEAGPEAGPVEAGTDAGKDAGPIKKDAGGFEAGAPAALVDQAEIGGGACACRATGAPAPKAVWLLAGLAGLVAAARRRRSQI